MLMLCSLRDDEHCTALMLAAAAGHAIVMKILLDNHASVNEVDKMKVSLLCLRVVLRGDLVVIYWAHSMGP